MHPESCQLGMPHPLDGSRRMGAVLDREMNGSIRGPAFYFSCVFLSPFIFELFHKRLQDDERRFQFGESCAHGRQWGERATGNGVGLAFEDLV